MMIEINECSAPILCECEECGSKFFDNEEHTPADCLRARKIQPERDEESIRFEQLNDGN
jgi:hypothetical protein